MTNLTRSSGAVLKTYSVLLFFLALKAAGNSSMAWGMKQVPERMSMNPALYLRAMLNPFVAMGVAALILALVIAEVYESAPYYVVGAQAAFAEVDPRMEQQAALLGDRPRRVFRRVTLPLASPGLAMALAVAWARAMGAFGAVIVIAYHPYGLPLQIWTTLQETGLASALPFALVLLVVALPLPLAAYVWSARAQSRRRG